MLFGKIEPHVKGYAKMALHQLFHGGPTHCTCETFSSRDGECSVLVRLDCSCGAVFYQSPSIIPFGESLCYLDVPDEDDDPTPNGGNA